MSVPSMAIAPVAHLATAEHFAEPAHQLGISIDMDLHTYQQTQHPGPKPGTLWLDGTLYSTALPERLRHIAAPALTQTAVEKAPLRDLFDKRRPYEMRPLTAPTEGVQRLRGPARRGKLRCPNVPKSMRAPQSTPLTGCTKNQPCGCGRTVTVHCGDHRRDRQRLPWQSTDGSTPTGVGSGSNPSTPRTAVTTPPSTAATSASSGSPP